MKTSIELSDDLVEQIREFNRKHRARPINMSGVCEDALRNALSKAKAEDFPLRQFGGA